MNIISNIFFLDDARLHSAPTYVHCKAGKSRSVTAVMAYLIHANRWTLSQAYSFVLERRKGISPNIGFVSELMGFEQHELGTKSMGVVSNGPNGDGAPPDPPHPTYGRPEDGPLSAAPAAGGNPAPPPTNGMAGSYGTAAGTRRQAHLRESLPPLNRPETEGTLVGAHTPEQGLGEEVEIRDGSGRYRHFRRAPVDDKTLQPMRRVSKAGLESTGWEWSYIWFSFFLSFFLGHSFFITPDFWFLELRFIFIWTSTSTLQTTLFVPPFSFTWVYLYPTIGNLTIYNLVKV
jgi:hypothetical protein